MSHSYPYKTHNKIKPSIVPAEMGILGHPELQSGTMSQKPKDFLNKKSLYVEILIFICTFWYYNFSLNILKRTS